MSKKPIILSRWAPVNSSNVVAEISHKVVSDQPYREIWTFNALDRDECFEIQYLDVDVLPDDHDWDNEQNNIFRIEKDQGNENLMTVIPDTMMARWDSVFLAFVDVIRDYYLDKPKLEDNLK